MSGARFAWVRVGMDETVEEDHLAKQLEQQLRYLYLVTMPSTEQSQAQACCRTSTGGVTNPNNDHAPAFL
jgi:hypothetical protein